MEPRNSIPRSLVSTGTAAKLAGTSPHLVRQAIKAKKLAAAVINGRSYVRSDEVMKVFSPEPRAA